MAGESGAEVLALLARALRRLTGSDVAVIATLRPSRAGAPATLQFHCSAVDSARNAAGDPTVGVPLSESPEILRIATGDGPLRSPVGDEPGLRALLPRASTLIGAPIRDDEGHCIGLALTLYHREAIDAEPAAWDVVLGQAAEVLQTDRGALRRGASSAADSAALATAQEAVARTAAYRRLLETSAKFFWRVDFAQPLAHDSTPEVRVREVLDRARIGEASAAFAARFEFQTPADLEGRRVGGVPGLWLVMDEARLAHLAASGFDRCEVSATEIDGRGRSRDLEATLIAVTDAEGIHGFWCVERDVSEERDRLDRFREAADVYGSALRASFDASCIVDSDRHVLECDDGFAQLAGTERAEIEGRPFTVALASGRLRGEMLDLATIAESGTWRGRGEVKRGGGAAPVPVEVLCVYSARGSGFVHCFLRDMRGPLSVQKGEVDHRQALAQVARLSTLGEMTSGIAHELNQPLAAIVNYANGCLRRLEQQETEDEVLVRALRSIVDQGRRAAEIIRRMRSFARRSDEKREPFSISDLLNEAIELTATQRRRAGIELIVDFGADPDDVVVDGIQIEQVALHLLRNAIDALERMPEDRPRILRVETRLATGAGAGEPIVEVSIVDSGPGVPESNAYRVFDPFYTTRPDGLGLGLTISRSIIESHGGRLRVVPPEQPATAGGSGGSSAGSSGGTCFRFTLPLRTAPIES